MEPPAKVAIPKGTGDDVHIGSLPLPGRRIAFRAWAAVLVIVFGVVFFDVISLVIGWFQGAEGVAGPVTELGYVSRTEDRRGLGRVAQLQAAD